MGESCSTEDPEVGDGVVDVRAAGILPQEGAVELRGPFSVRPLPGDGGPVGRVIGIG
jgi:hypothetical protein